MRFLSEEWAHAVEAACNADPAFASAAAGHTVTIQQVIAGPEGDTHYWTRLADGAIALGIGDVEAPDATIRQSYETAAGLARREINAVTAFMTGKIKVEGNLGQLMALQPILGRLADAMGTLDVEY
jgi:putative sterol carrier protein